MYSIGALISLNDLELPILAKNQEKLNRHGVRVIVSGPEVINIAFDKWETYKYIERIGLKSPKTFISLEETKAALVNGSIKFPLVVKPRWGSASIGIEFPETLEELDLVVELQKIKLQKTILKKASEGDLDQALVYQERLMGTEIGIDILNDFNGDYYGTFAREKLAMRSGETDKGKSIIDKEIEELGKKVGSDLKHIGNMDCDVFRTEEGLFLLELNPRFGGGYPFSHEAGINTAAIYLAWLRNETDIDKYNNYLDGLVFSKCDRLMPIIENKTELEN